MAASNYSRHVIGRQRKPGVIDRHTYIQNAKAYAKRGSELPQTKLTDDNVSDIRSAKKQQENMMKYIRENLTNDALALRFGVSKSAIEKVTSHVNFFYLS